MSILQAAEGLIIKKGYGALTMDDVAREAQFSKATLYRYFKNKGELIFEIAANYYRRVTANLREIRDEDSRPVEKLRQAIRFVLRFGQEKRNLSRVLMIDEFLPRSSGSPGGASERPASTEEKKFLGVLKACRKEMLDVGSEILKDGIAAGEFRAMDVMAGVTFLEAALQGYLHGELLSQKKHDLEAETELIHSFFLHGIMDKRNVKGGSR
jgi:AcrR family transcriptional regulator